MQPTQIITFADSRPFESFTAFPADGRKLLVQHPEMVLVAEHALGLWVFHEGGQVEAIAGELMTGLKTVRGVDPHSFIPQRDAEE